eukprot:4719188-Prymnesium_polylepis.1
MLLRRIDFLQKRKVGVAARLQDGDLSDQLIDLYLLGIELLARVLDLLLAMLDLVHRAECARAKELAKSAARIHTKLKELNNTQNSRSCARNYTKAPHATRALVYLFDEL